MSFVPGDPVSSWEMRYWLPMTLFGPIMLGLVDTNMFEQDPAAGSVEARVRALALSSATIDADPQIAADQHPDTLVQGAAVRIAFLQIAAGTIAETPRNVDDFVTLVLAATTAMWDEFKDNLPA